MQFPATTCICCKKLYEYSFFTAKAHAFWKELGNLEEGIKAAIKYCRKHDIMSELLEKNAKEILSMLYTEWNMEDALAVAREEGREKGWKERDRTIARNALAEGASLEFVQKITGLDLGTILELNN